MLKESLIELIGCLYFRDKTFNQADLNLEFEIYETEIASVLGTNTNCQPLVE